jgi:serine phosphatase RsbU (regulator of sigma subunit)
MERLWGRVSDGLAVEQLWGQFLAESRAGYRLYSLDAEHKGGPPEGNRFLATARSFFWAILLKLSPARRVVLLLALILAIARLELTVGQAHIRTGALGVLLLVWLLLLEIADRVTMKRDLEIAREIQLWLVPSEAPRVAGLDVAWMNRPANTVAGDYYDLIPHRGQLVLVVADVAGKSIPAALLMATLQASLRTLCTTPAPLGELVAALNSYVCAHSRGGQRFTTAFLGEYDPATRRFTYINAGHNAPILRRASGKIERLEEGGVPLGVLPQVRYAGSSTTLEPGDLLLVFTDGVPEAVNDRGAEFGEPRLVSWIQPAPSGTAAELLGRLTQELSAFVGVALQHDDMTCVVVRAV